MNQHINTVKEYQGYYPDDVREAFKEVVKYAERCEILESAIRQTLDENGHLADGLVCTLKRLKDAIGEE